MTKVEVKNGDINGALKRFKLKVAKSGVPSELKKHKLYRTDAIQMTMKKPGKRTQRLVYVTRRI